jgi:hypothetical protein
MSSGSADVLGKLLTESIPLSSVGHLRHHSTVILFKQIIAHWLQSPTFMTWQDSQARGVNIQNLRFSGSQNYRYPFLHALQSIAAILDKADDRRLRRMRSTSARCICNRCF